jgi:hypothetical protein
MRPFVPPGSRPFRIIAIANTAPQHAFSVGSNLYVDTESSNVLTVDGNVVCEGVKVGLIEIIPSYDLAAVSNVGNVTQSTIQFSNATTGFVTTANIEVGTANLFVDTTTSRVGVNTATPDASLHVTGNAYVSSNLEVGTANLFVDTVNSRVGVGTDDPGAELHVMGDIIGRSISKTRTITKGASLSDETETFTLNPDENRIVLNNNQGSIGSTRIYRANFTSGVPTTVGTVLHLEINSQRVNTDGVGRGHQSVIQFDGTSILDTGYIVLGATGGNDSYDRQLQRTIILTDDGWKDYSMYPKISAPTTDDAIIFSTTEHAISTDLGNTELTERMRITNTGNVGIGTNAPGNKFEVLDNSAFAVDVSVAEHVIVGNKYSTADSLSLVSLGSVNICCDANDNSTDKVIDFRTNSYTDGGSLLMRIKDEGSVGIGTANPTQRFVVAKTDNVASTPVMELMVSTTFDNPNPNPSLYRLLDFSTNADSGKRHCSINLLNYNNSGGGQYDITERLKTGLGFSVRNGGSVIENALSISYTGDVGINDSTPSYTLDVNGTISANNVSPSDDRIKYNEQNVSNALTLISQLNPQKYEKIMERPNPTEGTWIPTDEEWENVKEDYTYGDEFGFIAQDVRNIPELAFLVHGEETRTDTKTSTPEEYSNLTTEEQSTYTISYLHESNVVTQEQYSNLSPEEQEVSVTQYTKQIETQTPLALNYQGLFVVAIGAIKELKAKNDALEARITALENA